MTPSLRRSALALALLAFGLAGCSPSAVKVTGTLTKNGQPMVVSEDTYVTLSFVPEGKSEGQETSYSAKFDQKTGTYSVELPPGNYRTMLIVALPGSKKDGKLNAPTPPVKSDKVYQMTKDQQLDIEVPGK